MYNKTVMDHFRNPRNVGVIEEADGVGEVGNPLCGDMMTIYLKIKDDHIADIKFQTFGCGSAIAVSSMITEIAKGKSLADAKQLTNKEHEHSHGEKCYCPYCDIEIQEGITFCDACQSSLEDEH
jgi:nitrogen fixation NifU-like protein